MVPTAETVLETAPNYNSNRWNRYRNSGKCGSENETRMLTKSSLALAVFSVLVVSVVAVPLPEKKSSEPGSAAPIEGDRDSSRLQRYSDIGLKPHKVVRYQPVECVHPDSAPYLPRQVLEGSGLIPSSATHATQDGVTAEGGATPNAVPGAAVMRGASNMVAGGAMGNGAVQPANGVGTPAEGMTGGLTGGAEGSTASVNNGALGGVEGASTMGGTMHPVAAPASIATADVAVGGAPSVAQAALNGAPQTGAGDAVTGTLQTATGDTVTGAPGAAPESAAVAQSAPAIENRQVTAGIEQGAAAAAGGDAMAAMGLTSSSPATNDSAMIGAVAAGESATNGASGGAPSGDASGMMGVGVTTVGSTSGSGGLEGGAAAAATSTGAAVGGSAAVTTGGVAPVVSADVGQSGLFGTDGSGSPGAPVTAL